MNLSVNSAAIGTIILSRSSTLTSTLFSSCQHRRTGIHTAITKLLTSVRRRLRGLNQNSRPVHLTVANSNNLTLTSDLSIPFIRRIVTRARTVSGRCPRTSIVVRLNNRSTGVACLGPAPRRHVGNSYTNNANTFVSRVTALLSASTTNLGRVTARCRALCPVTSHYNIFTGASLRPLVGSNTTGPSLTTSVFATITARAVTNLTSKHPVRKAIVFLNNPLFFVSRLQTTFGQTLSNGISRFVIPASTRLCITCNTTLRTSRSNSSLSWTLQDAGLHQPSNAAKQAKGPTIRRSSRTSTIHCQNKSRHVRQATSSQTCPSERTQEDPEATLPKREHQFRRRRDSINRQQSEGHVILLYSRQERPTSNDDTGHRGGPDQAA